MFSNLSFIRYCKHPTIKKTLKSGICAVCGYNGDFIFQKIINDDLASTWQINLTEREDFDNRESLKCRNCSASLRIRNMAKAILQVENSHKKSIKELANCKNFMSKSIAEINNCGAIHTYIKNMPKLNYSEYNPDYHKKVNNEDLQKLSYENNYFDYIFTSDTLEHIPDTQKALQEIHRVLKPGGYHIFTVPLLTSRKETKKRAELKDGGINYIEPKSYHGQDTDDYLVFYEFGRDLPRLIRRQGFAVMIYYCNMYFDEHSFVFVTRKKA